MSVLDSFGKHPRGRRETETESDGKVRGKKQKEEKCSNEFTRSE